MADTSTGLLSTATPAAPKATGMIADWYADYLKAKPKDTQQYTATAASAGNWSVDPNQTVQTQIGGIIKADSPLMQMARTSSLQDQAAKGLGNSSLAIGEGQKAVYGAAMPIASQDASTYASAAKTNAELATQTNIANAGFSNDASKFNAGAVNTASMQQYDLAGQGYRQQADIGAQAQRQQADIAYQKSAQSAEINMRNAQQQYDIAAQAARLDTSLSAQDKLQKADAELKMALQASDAQAQAQRQTSFQNYDATLKTAMQQTDQAGRVQLQQIGDTARQALAETEAKYKTGMQTSASMAQTYQAMIDGMTRIMGSADLDATGKQAAVNQLTQLYSGALKSQEAISGLKLGELLIDPLAVPATTPAVTDNRATWQQGMPLYGSAGGDASGDAGANGSAAAAAAASGPTGEH